VNVKAQGLLHGTAWLRETFGEGGLQKVLDACGPNVRERAKTAIGLNWIPQEELAEFLRVADRELVTGDGKIAEAIGAASARVNLRHMALRIAFFLGRPEFLMRRVAGVWRQYNEAGDMTVHELTTGGMRAELVGVPDPDWYICCSVTGWMLEAGHAMGMKRLFVHHAECRALGKAHCLWELRWDSGRLGQPTQPRS
jgi:hypothetical protein